MSERWVDVDPLPKSDRTLAERAREAAQTLEGGGMNLVDIRILLRSLADLCDTYREALEATTEELNCWGWGDMHYGNTPQESRVVEAVKRARLALATGEQARVVEAEEEPA